MKEFLKIAWRNLWRNKRRTLITVSSVFFAVFLALIMRSMQLASYDMMIENAVRTSTGYIQVQAKGYWDDKTINNTFGASDTLLSRIEEMANVTAVIPRLESFALASFGEQTKGVGFVGTDPHREDQVTALSDKIVAGKYLEEGSNGILLSKGLADYLNATVGDSVVFLSQGYHGSTAAGLYRVSGIMDLPMPEMNNQMVYTTLGTAQRFYEAHDRFTSYSIMLEDPDKIGKTAENLRMIDPERLEIMTWDQMLVEMVQGIQSDNISGLFMLGILYLVVGFGILGTIIMLTMERKKEFGIMIAVGMRKSKLMIILFFETLMIAFMGIVAGVVVSVPVLAYMTEHPIPLTGEAAEAMKEFNAEPVLPFMIEPGFYINQSMVVIIIALLTVLYPVVTIGKLQIVKAIKGR